MATTPLIARRRWLRTCVAVGALALAGCFDDGDGTERDGTGDDGTNGAASGENGGEPDDDGDRTDRERLPTPTLGTGSVPIDVYVDFGCPACHQFKEVVFPTLEEELLDTGDATYRHFDFPIPAHERSVALANAARAVQDDTRTDDDHAGAFFAYEALVFDADDWSDGSLAALAGDVGADPGAVATALEDDRYLETLLADRTRGEESGVRGTPTVLVDGTRLEDPFDLEAILERVDEAT